MTNTQRTSRKQAEGYATAWGTRPDGIVQLATDYLAALDVLEEIVTSAEEIRDPYRLRLIEGTLVEAARAFLASTEGGQP